MKRLVVLLFALVVARRVSETGVSSWLEATLAITVILALPLLSALERADPKATLAVMTALIARVGDPLATHPSEWDDHRDDSSGVGAGAPSQPVPLACPRTGIMLHYDDSTRDDWAVEWFGARGRVPHAGLTPMANSRFYGISAATNGLVPATALRSIFAPRAGRPATCSTRLQRSPG